MKSAIVLTLLLGATPAAAAQQRSAPDSATVAAYRQLLLGLRDTVDVVSSRSAEFRRDLRTVGDGTVIARGQRLSHACRSVRDALAEARPALSRLPAEDRARAERDSLLLSMRNLELGLDVECVRGLNPEGAGQRADTLRAWGPNRTANLSVSITAYNGAALRLARRFGIDLTRY